jgi:hypothetical protein
MFEQLATQGIVKEEDLPIEILDTRQSLFVAFA